MYKKAIDRMLEKDNLISENVKIFFDLEKVARAVKAKEATSSIMWTDTEEEIPIGEFAPHVVFKVIQRTLKPEESETDQAVETCKSIVEDWLKENFNYDMGDELTDELMQKLDSVKDRNEVISSVEDLSKIDNNTKIKKMTFHLDSEGSKEFDIDINKGR
jgi:hypothetical protein